MSNLELFHRPPPFGKGALRLQTSRDVRIFLGKLIGATARREVDPDIAGRLGFLSSILLRAIENSDFEDRIKRLEEALEKQ